MKDYLFKIDVDGKEYPFVFNLNVMEAIQGEYGTLDEWQKRTEQGAPVDESKPDGERTGESDAKALVYGFTQMVNEALDMQADEAGETFKPLTTKQVARILSKYGLGKAFGDMKNAMIESTKSDEKN